MRTADAQLGPFQPQVSAVGQHALFTEEAEYFSRSIFYFSSSSEVGTNMIFGSTMSGVERNKKARLEYRPLEMDGRSGCLEGCSVFDLRQTVILQTMVCVFPPFVALLQWGSFVLRVLSYSRLVQSMGAPTPPTRSRPCDSKAVHGDLHSCKRQVVETTTAVVHQPIR